MEDGLANELLLGNNIVIRAFERVSLGTTDDATVGVADGATLVAIVVRPILATLGLELGASERVTLGTTDDATVGVADGAPLVAIVVTPLNATA